MKLKTFYKRFVSPIVQLRPKNIRRYSKFFRQREEYLRRGGSIDNLWPVLGEDTATTGIDPHYFYQGVWAAQHIARQRPTKHVDVGSQVGWVGLLSAITDVYFVDLRPLEVTVPRLTCVRGSVLDLPFSDRSVQSLSCLHVAEHIGLGRYGDPLDPEGTRKACVELARVLAPGGQLYFSLPIGRERTEFNAHRIHRPSTILRYFPELTLIEFSAVSDKGQFSPEADIGAFDNARYACGFFRFTR